MIKTTDFRKGNLIAERDDSVIEISGINGDETIRIWNKEKTETLGCFSLDCFNPIPLTKELARDLGFTVTDMGDFWEFTKGDFTLIQLKVPMTGKVLIPFYILHSEKSKYIKVPYVHKLQNLYYEIEGTELTLKQ